MTYEILITYESGNSNGDRWASRARVKGWQNLDKAKAALRRIEEYSLWRKDVRWNENPKPTWLTTDEDYRINLEMDDGTEKSFHAGWCGYFEDPVEAFICVNDPDWRVDLR